MAKATPVPIRSYRRHLFITDALSWVKPNDPFTWNISDPFYLRPEANGLLLCPCDEEEHPPGFPSIHPVARELLEEKIKRYPALGPLSIRSSWAGLRTFSSDRRFVIGWDPILAGFFWVAGLGGHGVTASGAIGRLASDLIGGVERKGMWHFSPERFVQT
jgi:glycine/D-amino acid oxidase-like deaminating enzyme